MAQQSIALTRQFLVTRLFPNLNSPKELDSNQQKDRGHSITDVFRKTYAVFPNAINFSWVQDPLPPIVVKISQLNWAAAGFSKVSQNIRCTSGQSALATIEKFGEDACFALTNSRRKDYIGIADGVGGWRDRGFDPSVFSSSLMRICKDMANKKQEDPMRLIDDSYNKLLLLNKKKNFQIVGSSTVCILSFEQETGILTTANLGDSGYLIVRNGEIIDRSEKQTHKFNIPKQLAYAPPSLRFIADMPSDAHEKKFVTHPGDLIVTATDGLFDNVPDEVLIQELSYLPHADQIENQDLERSAKRLASRAHKNALNKSYVSPFALAAKSAGFHYTGGKMDDVTVIVSVVSDLGTAV